MNKKENESWKSEEILVVSRDYLKIMSDDFDFFMSLFTTEQLN